MYNFYIFSKNNFKGVDMKKILLVAIICCVSLFCFFGNASKNIVAFASEEYDAKSVVLIDYDSGKILYEKEKDKQLPIASMVKLMTVLLTLENIDNGNLTLDTKVCVSPKASGMGGSQVFLDANNEYTVEDLLKSTIVASANDASVALAETIAGSESAFVDLMNAKAKELGMANTNYANATGLPMPNGYSCAIDIANLMREVLKHPTYFNYSTIWMDELTHPSGRKTELTNTNRLIRYYKGCDAGKTGSTNEAGYCVSASAKKNDLRLISVVIGAKTGAERFSQAGTLLDYGFANYQNKKLFSAGQEIDSEIKVAGAKECVKPIAKSDCYALTQKNDSQAIDLKVQLLDMTAPLKKGDKVGTLYAVKNGEVINEVDLILPIDLPKYSYIDSFNDVIKKWTL